jgi:Ca-activated chloride channel family protein
MRAILLFSLFCFSHIHAQTGSVLIKCLDSQTNLGIDNLTIEFKADSTAIKGRTANGGIHLQQNLKVGQNKFIVLSEKIKDTLSGSVFIQANQLAQLTFFINSEYSQLMSSAIGNHVKLDAKGMATDQFRMNQSLGITQTYSVLEVQCVTIVAYSLPMLNRDGGYSGASITREDISRLPVRSVNGIASTVGGVNMNESFNEIHIRGSRNGTEAYYLDGIRISNPDAIPKSYIGNVSVYTNGIPANYGDLTGGVIAVESVNRNKLEYDRTKNRKINHVPVEEEVDPVFSGYRPLSYDHFLPLYENDFLSPKDHPHSTFGLDVDRASWTFIKRRIAEGGDISRDAVKIEEMINSFSTKKITPREDELIHLEIERNTCEWNTKHQLVSIHLQAKELPRNEERKIHNLVFLVDVSGSMSSQDKLPLLVNGLKKFVKTLDERDRVAIVTYAGYSAIVLEPTSCNDQNKILDALDRLISNGSTNGIGGIMEAYRLAEKNYDPKLNNRIILCTDGDFNVGINSVGDLEIYIEEKRGKGIYLTALGFGMGNYKNSTLETLADKGDGNHFYISDLHDMNEVLVQDLGNLINIARDVKLNVEFNPQLVKSYRLIGYENRLLRPKDFIDDTKDGGEIGYGHKVTAVYEIELGIAENVENHFSNSTSIDQENELAFVKLRYKPFEEKESIEQRFALTTDVQIKENRLLNMIIGLGLHLRDSAFKGDLTIKILQELARSFNPQHEDEFELKRIILSL